MGRTRRREAKKTHSIEAAVQQNVTFAYHPDLTLHSGECRRCGRVTLGQEKTVQTWAYNHMNRLHYELI